MLAVSGIDSTVKIFSPDRRAQRDARLGRKLGIAPGDDTLHSSLSFSGRRRRASAQRAAHEDAQHATVPESSEAPNSTADANATDDEDLEEQDGEAPPTSTSGLSSRRRMQDEYRITSQNDVDRRGGQNDAFITVSGPAFPLRTVPMSFAVWIAMHEQSVL